MLPQNVVKFFFSSCFNLTLFSTTYQQQVFFFIVTWDKKREPIFYMFCSIFVLRVCKLVTPAIHFSTSNKELSKKELHWCLTVLNSNFRCDFFCVAFSTSCIDFLIFGRRLPLFFKWRALIENHLKINEKRKKSFPKTPTENLEDAL